ncbi:hypothetical protein FVEN_g13179 [Fusarium venenatum]|nr:hypothetical protein FVEN_g13179 [Fusarium venenatum]
MLLSLAHLVGVMQSSNAKDVCFGANAEEPACMCSVPSSRQGPFCFNEHDFTIRIQEKGINFTVVE